MAFTQRHLLGLEGVSADEIITMLDTAESFKEISERDIKKVPTLRGKTVINLFYEASTRTRTSFEIAAKRLSADTINVSASTSSTCKGETLADTARNLEAMRPDAIVVRHPSSGACHLLARHVSCPILNAGDGCHEHPTQALLDLLTIRERLGDFTGRTVTIVGDVLHSRVARSNLHALRALGATVRLVGPPTLLPPDLARLGAELHTSLEAGVRDTDVIMMLRIQRERQGANYFPTLDEYSRYFCLTEDAVRLARPHVIILHPGPLNRGLEISSAVADGPYSVIMDQVTNGVAVRMALLYLLVNRAKTASAGDAALEPAIAAEPRRQTGVRA
jgi:aspartate carbamoyltransferase catalytic subunit